MLPDLHTIPNDLSDWQYSKAWKHTIRDVAWKQALSHIAVESAKDTILTKTPPFSLSLFIAALFVKVKYWKESKYPSLKGWLKKQWCVFFPGGFLGGSDGKVSAYNVGRPGFNPWVGKISWRRKWQPTPVFLPGKSHEWGACRLQSIPESWTQLSDWTTPCVSFSVSFFALTFFFSIKPS